MKNIQKIMLGGAQFGMHYGIANSHGQVAEQEISKILQLADSIQISNIDTASAYGVSEEILGKLASSNFRIVTKLSPLDQGIDDLGHYVRKQLSLSLKRLRRESCKGLLVHHVNDLLGEKGDELYTVLSELKTENKIKKIGVSVYSPDQVEALLDRYTLDIIQFPLNLFDQRFLKNKLLSKLKEENIELHARSIFLQGLLLMNEITIPKHLTHAIPLLQRLDEECNQKGIQIRLALIEFVMSIKEIDYYIFGIDNHKQLSEIIADVGNSDTHSRIQFENYACEDLSLINPMNWAKA
ncbi:MAG: aldo/keto reductase [Gammaproteobacteria bacterium]|nr:aldo/keto reductase [Gammaproteobacteria bacterium]